MLESAVTGRTAPARTPSWPATGWRARPAPPSATTRRAAATAATRRRFVGFAPAEAPEIVVAVIVQDPKSGDLRRQSAAPVFQKIMSTALAAEGVPASTGVHEPFPLTW